MLKLCAAGDVILMDQLPEGYSAMAQPLIDYVNQSDVKIANLETTLSYFDCFASTYCGTPWLCAPPARLDDLTSRFDFQLYSFANNHTLDYFYTGMQSTLDAFRKRGLAVCGAGIAADGTAFYGESVAPDGSLGKLAGDQLVKLLLGI